MMKEILARMELGKKKYGHGVRVDDDTTTWGTKENSWMEMAREEFLDAVIYVIADYIRKHRVSDGTKDDDNELIHHTLVHWKEMEPGRHKNLLRTLINILGWDQDFSMVEQSDSELFDGSSGPIL